jgi:hypothetical protein
MQLDQMDIVSPHLDDKNDEIQWPIKNPSEKPKDTQDEALEP